MTKTVRHRNRERGDLLPLLMPRKEIWPVKCAVASRICAWEARGLVAQLVASARGDVMSAPLIVQWARPDVNHCRLPSCRVSDRSYSPEMFRSGKRLSIT
jgi:hypothetical protein